MKPADQEKLKQILASFDEAGLVALANVGLVRRARKDLEAGPVTHEETETAIIVKGPDWSVTMPPDGPTKATDNTRATGITRQILSATIYLQQHWLGGTTTTAVAATEPAVPREPATENPKPSASDEGAALADAVVNLTAADLEKWAGKNAFKQVLALCEPMPTVTAEITIGLAIRLEQHGIEARLFPGAPTKAQQLLDSFRTTGPKAQQVRWVLMAVLGFQASKGKITTRAENLVSVAPTGTAASREQVLNSARELFRTMLSTGLAHLSERTSQRLFTLSVSATAVLFPRLAKLVRSIAADVDLHLERHANADSRRLLDLLVNADALCRALLKAGESPSLKLTGRPRTEYEPAADLHLHGVGAFPWQSASGFEGVTCLFWDASKQRFLTWTASRPVTNPGRFSARMSYDSEQLWRCAAPEMLCRSDFVLGQPKINPQGRLSGGKESRAEVTAKTDPTKINFGERLFTNWLKLAGYLGQTYPMGLAESEPMDRIVVLKPTSWGERVFVELTQSLHWTINDEKGIELQLSVPWNGVNEPIVEFLESVKPDRDNLIGVVARVALEGTKLTVEPLSLLSSGTSKGDTILNPGFDRHLLISKQASLLEKLRAKYGKDRIPTTISDEDGESLEELSADDESNGMIPKKLRDFEHLLVMLAEGGTQRIGLYTDRLNEQLRDLQQCGLSEFPNTINNTDELLQTGYRAGLHRQACRAAQLGQVLVG
jgi:hypothetical protein